MCSKIHITIKDKFCKMCTRPKISSTTSVSDKLSDSYKFDCIPTRLILLCILIEFVDQ